MKKINLILPLVLIVMLILSSAAQASDLEKEMKNIGKNCKLLKLSVADPAKKTEALQEIGSMIKSAEAARQLTPKKTSEIPEASRSQFITDYQKQIDKLIEQFKKIESDLMAGKIEDAKADFSKISGIKREGHEKFAAKE